MKKKSKSEISIDVNNMVSLCVKGVTETFLVTQCGMYNNVPVFELTNTMSINKLGDIVRGSIIYI